VVLLGIGLELACHFLANRHDLAVLARRAPALDKLLSFTQSAC
jgi:short-subunit dehydrogenase